MCKHYSMHKFINNFAPQTREANADQTEKYQVTFDISMNKNFDNQFEALQMLELIFMKNDPIKKWGVQMTINKIDSVERPDNR